MHRSLHLTSGVFTCEDTKSQPQTRKPGQSYKSNYTWTKRRSGKRKGNPPPFIYPAPCRMEAAGSQAGRALAWVDSSRSQSLLHCDSTVNTHAPRWSLVVPGASVFYSLLFEPIFSSPLVVVHPPNRLFPFLVLPHELQAATSGSPPRSDFDRPAPV